MLWPDRLARSPPLVRATTQEFTAERLQRSILVEGQAYTTPLGYAPLPDSIRSKVATAAAALG